MPDDDVHETIVGEQSIYHKVDELVLENIEPVSHTKRKKISTTTSEEPKEPKTPRSRKPKIITVSVDNTTFEFDAAKDAPPVPLAPPTPPTPEGPTPEGPTIPTSDVPLTTPEPKPKAKAKSRPRPKKPKEVKPDSMQVDPVNADLGKLLTDEMLDKALAQRISKIREDKIKQKDDKYRELAEKAFYIFYLMYIYIRICINCFLTNQPLENNLT